MRPLSPRQVKERLGKLEAKNKATDDANAFGGLIFLHGDEPEGDHPSGTCVIRFVKPGQCGTTEYRLPHNGREAWPVGQA